MVMRSMRASAKWIMLVVAIAFGGWMIFDVGMDITGQGGSSETVLRINGTKVTYQNFLLAVRNEGERERNRTGSGPVTLEDQRQLEDRVIEQFIMDVILYEEYRRRGISVSDEEVLAAAQTSPPPEVMSASDFQTDGQFDIAKYQRYLAAGADPQFLFALESRYRSEIPRVKLYEQLATDVYVSDNSLWWDYRDGHDSAIVAVAIIQPNTAISDDEAALSEAELESYYREHADEYRRPAAAYVSYVSVSRRTNAADSAAALALASDIRRRLLEGADFEEVAASESADSASRASGGNLGEVALGRFHQAFESAALALDPEEISEPILTPFGYHIIRLESRNGDTYNPSHILVAFELRGDHLAEVEDMADSLDIFGAEQIEPGALDEVADRFGLPIIPAGRLFELDRLTIGRFRVPDVGIWAFETLPGETSQVVENPEAYYLFRLDSVIPEQLPPLGEIEATVRNAALTAKKTEVARQLVERLLDEIGPQGNLFSLAARPGFSVDSVGPVTRRNAGTHMLGQPQAIGAAFGREFGQVAGPFESDLGMLVAVMPLSRFVADSSSFLAQLETLRQDATARERDSRIRGYLAALREDVDLIDRRREIEEIQRELAEGGGLPGIPQGF